MMQRVATSAAKRRARLEEEFGLPFERARKLRAKYYAQGYGACRQKTAEIVRQNRLLSQQVDDLQQQLGYYVRSRVA